MMKCTLKSTGDSYMDQFSTLGGPTCDVVTMYYLTIDYRIYVASRVPLITDRLINSSLASFFPAVSLECSSVEFGSRVHEQVPI